MPWRDGDLPTPFEICWYHQGEIIQSGFRRSAHYCDRCRPVVRAWNDRLDAAGLVSFPVGRHTLQHHWRHAHLFTAAPIVGEWRTERLREGRSGSGLTGTEWLGLTAMIGRTRPTWRRWPCGSGRPPTTW